MNHRLLEIFSEVEEFHWWFVGRRYLLNKKIQEQFGGKKTLKILDIGCGTGGSYSFLSSFGKVYGVDFSKTAIEYARKKGIKNLKIANATKLPFKNNEFDLVLALDVFEHVEDDQKALSEAKRVVKKNGIIILTVPALPFIWGQHDELQNHYRRYDKKRLINISKKNRLKILEISYFNSFLSLPIIFVRKLSGKNGFDDLGQYDSKINFEIARVEMINKTLWLIFKTELYLRRLVAYPIGISLLGVFKKS